MAPESLKRSQKCRSMVQKTWLPTTYYCWNRCL